MPPVSAILTQPEPRTQNGTDSQEWTKSFSDFNGREYKTVFAKAAQPHPTATTTFNPKGQMASQIDPDNVITRYNYNLEGQTVDVGIEMNNTSSIEENGTDRIHRTLQDVVYNSTMGKHVRRVQSVEFPINNQVTTLVTSIVETSVDGLATWRTAYGQVTKSTTAYPSAGVRTVTVLQPDGTKIVQTYTSGRLTRVENQDSNNIALTRTDQNYDAHGRLSTVVDLRTGTTTYTYGAMDRVATVTTTAPGNGQPAQVTTTTYDPLGRVKQVQHPDNTFVKNEYFPTGLPKKTYGSRTYPVEYTYDAQGRMTEMKTWQQFDEINGTGTGGASITKWNYDAYRGWLASKRDANNVGADYSYYPSGRLHIRTWARGTPRLTTTHSYNSAGDLTSMAFTGAHDNTYTYDRRGRVATVLKNGITTTYTYLDSGQVASEVYSGAGTPMAGLSVHYTYSTLPLRRTAVETRNNSTVLSKNTYSYETTTARLLKVGDGGATEYSATYGYVPTSTLVGSVTFKQGSTTRLTTTRQYDLLNRLAVIHSVASGETTWPISHNYLYNNANQRVRMTLAEGSYWLYEYDDKGQVISGKRYWNDHMPVPGQQYEYSFDDIGNRTVTKSGGDANGAGLRSANYTRNLLNQYTQREVPGTFDILGLASSGATVTVGGNAADYRRGEYFWEPLTVNNSSAAVWSSVAITATSGGNITSVTGNMFVAKTPEVFDDASTPAVNEGYDLDGNQLRDGRWTYVWDAENRLTDLIANTAVGPQQRITFEYDAQGRRIRKRVWSNTAGSGAPASESRYLYDGWNLLTELNGANAVQRSYLWGLDLSGSLQGAGGVGGLLMVRNHVSPTGYHFVAYDGNGNVVGLADGATGTWNTRYEYDPFGQIVRATGTMAKLNPFRFSTKYTDDETDFLYYGYRYYNPSTGRWLSRDPIGEMGSINMFQFNRNKPINYIDALGLHWLDNAANFSAGVADALTGGVTSWLRQKLAIDDQVHYDGGIYLAGEWIEITVETTVTLGGAVLRKRATKYVDKAGREFLEGKFPIDARTIYRNAHNLVGKGGIIHHLNPIRQGRFPLPFKWAARSDRNLHHLPGSNQAALNVLHRAHHWWLRLLDTADYVRTWSAPIRAAAAEINRIVNADANNAVAVRSPRLESEPNCLYAPDITIENSWSVLIGIDAWIYGNELGID